MLNDRLTKGTFSEKVYISTVFQTFTMKYVAYYRTSTVDQILGIEAQKTAATNFINENDVIINTYIEHESGRNCSREQLKLAIDECVKNKCKLLIARLDRLSRNASFTLKLLDSKVEFVCADMPSANNLTIGIMALLAEEEAKRISLNTRKALQEVKRKFAMTGKTLGTDNLTQWGRLKSSQARSEIAKKNNHQVIKIIKRLRASGSTFEAISSELNEDGYTTSRGNKWTKSSVYKIFIRY